MLQRWLEEIRLLAGLLVAGCGLLVVFSIFPRQDGVVDRQVDTDLVFGVVGDCRDRIRTEQWDTEVQFLASCFPFADLDGKILGVGAGDRVVVLLFLDFVCGKFPKGD